MAAALRHAACSRHILKGEILLILLLRLCYMIRYMMVTPYAKVVKMIRWLRHVADDTDGYILARLRHDMLLGESWLLILKHVAGVSVKILRWRY